MTPVDMLASCLRCKRASYSLTAFGFCPWCDTVHRPGPNLLPSPVVIGGHDFHLTGAHRHG